MTAETTITTEWWDPVRGAWTTVGEEHPNVLAAIAFIEGLENPAEPGRFRIITTTVQVLVGAAATCQCGQWPIAEYGPVCPSCSMAVPS